MLNANRIPERASHLVLRHAQAEMFSPLRRILLSRRDILRRSWKLAGLALRLFSVTGLTLSGFAGGRTILRHQRLSEEDLNRLRQFLLSLPRGSLCIGLTTFEFIDPRRQLRQGLRLGVQIRS